VLDLEIGDYLCHSDTGDWWTLGEEPTVGKDPDTTTLVLRNVYDGERETTEVPSDAIIDVTRPCRIPPSGHPMTSANRNTTFTGFDVRNVVQHPQ
jgi:hypothetical protein